MRASAEAKGERPREFPNEATKAEYVLMWRNRFDQHFAKMEEAKAEGLQLKRTKLLRIDATVPTEDQAALVLRMLAELGGAGG